jgi:4-hydroxy-3-polyprenylbenzoate decarboxylase
VLINAWGSYRRMEMALGCNDAGPGVNAGHTPGGFEALAARIGSLVKPEPPSSLAGLFAKAKELLPLLRIPPKRRRGRGLCQEVTLTGDAVDLRRWPFIRCWPHDGDFSALGYPAGVNDGVPGLGRGDQWETHHRGRYITLAGIHTIHADDRDHPRPPSHNIGMYRVQLLGRRAMAMHWHVHHDGARHWRSWKARGEPMPVAVVLGGPSVMPYAATAPLPPGISELLLAGFLNRGGIEMVRAATVPLWVPANAEIVIEGYVSARAGNIGYDPRRDGPVGEGGVFEGPFGDHTGFYSLPDRYPVLEVTAVTHRRDPIYPTTVVGLPPQEDYFLGKATERVFFPLLKTLIHDIEDYDLPMFGAFHNCAFVKIKKQYPLQARRVMHSIWGAGQMAWTKTIFVVDEDVDVHDPRAVLLAAARNCDPWRDVEKVNGPLDILDHAAPRLGAGMKIGFDCTRKAWPDEFLGGIESTGNALPVEAGGDVPAASETGAALLARVAALPRVRAAGFAEGTGGGWLLVSIRKDGPGQGRAVLEALASAPGDFGPLPPFVVVVGEHVAVAPREDPDRNGGDAFFHWCAHSDASRDTLAWADPHRATRHLGFDATPKLPGDGRPGAPVRDWPPMLSMPDSVRTAVGGIER